MLPPLTGEAELNPSPEAPQSISACSTLFRTTGKGLLLFAMTASTAPAKSRNVQYTVTATATITHTVYVNVPRGTTPEQLTEALVSTTVVPVYDDSSVNELADDLSKAGIDAVVESIDFSDIDDYSVDVDPDAEDVDDEV